MLMNCKQKDDDDDDSGQWKKKKKNREKLRWSSKHVEQGFKVVCENNYFRENTHTRTDRGYRHLVENNYY